MRVCKSNERQTTFEDLEVGDTFRFINHYAGGAVCMVLPDNIPENYRTDRNRFVILEENNSSRAKDLFPGRIFGNVNNHRPVEKIKACLKIEE